MARKMIMNIPGQMDMFTYLAELPTQKQVEDAENVLNDKVKSFKSKKEEIISAADEYLKKGERLVSLAKEKYEKMVSRLSFSSVEKKLYQLNVKSYEHYELVPKIASTVIRPLLRKLSTYDDSDEAYKLLKQLSGDVDITIFLTKELNKVSFPKEGVSIFKLKFLFK